MLSAQQRDRVARFPFLLPVAKSGRLFNKNNERDMNAASELGTGWEGNYSALPNGSEGKRSDASCLSGRMKQEGADHCISH